MRQRILGSHTPPCHRRMVITTWFIVFALMHCSADQFCTTPGGTPGGLEGGGGGC